MTTATTQPEVQTETAEATPATTETTDVKETQPPAPETKSFDPNAIPQEVKDHFSKQYDGFDRFKAMADEYTRLLQAPEFRTWYDGLRNPKPKESQDIEISPDQYAAAMSDPKQFKALVTQLARQVASSEFAPRIEQTHKEVELAKRTTEIKETCAKYPDFMELDRKGLIEPQLAKYPGLSFEDAYWLAKRHTINEDADRRARGIVDSKKRATVEKPGNVGNTRSTQVKVKTREQAMQIAAEAFRAGREIPDFDFE